MWRRCPFVDQTIGAALGMRPQRHRHVHGGFVGFVVCCGGRGRRSMTVPVMMVSVPWVGIAMPSMVRIAAAAPPAEAGGPACGLGLLVRLRSW